MGPVGWIITALGFGLLLAVLDDIVSSTFHPDHDGRLSQLLQRRVWRFHVSIARRFRQRLRRRIMAAAGPTLMVSTLVMWAGLFIVAFALMIWPHLESAYASDRLEDLGFFDAVYYSGITGTVLGYGDITPIHWLAQLAAFAESGIGFMLLTLIVTHLLTILDGIGRRDQFTLDVWGESDGTFDGAVIVERALRGEGPDALRQRLENLARGMRMMQERFHRFPMLAFYIRSADPTYDPEQTIKAIGDAAVAAHVAAVAHPSLGVAAEHVERALRHFTGIVSAQYVASARWRLDEPDPEESDRATVAQAFVRLGIEPADDDPAVQDRLADLARHTRAFLEELNRLTRWREVTGDG